MAKSQIALKITKKPRVRQKTPMTSEKALHMVIGTHSLPTGTTSELRAPRLIYTTQIIPTYSLLGVHTLGLLRRTPRATTAKLIED